MRKSSGFILITVLIFIQIFSLLSLYGLMYASANMKNNDHLWYSYIYRLKSNKILHQLESMAGVNPKACTIPVIPATVLALKSISWWQLNACNANVDGIRYYYVVEALGDDPCGRIGKDNNNHLLIAKYFRITLYMLPDRLKGAKYLLQSTIALPRVQTAICEQNSHKVKPGRQMWREI